MLGDCRPDGAAVVAARALNGKETISMKCPLCRSIVFCPYCVTRNKSIGPCFRFFTARGSRRWSVFVGGLVTLSVATG